MSPSFVSFSLRMILVKDWLWIIAAIILFVAVFAGLEYTNTHSPLLQLDGDQLFYMISAVYYQHHDLFSQGMFAVEGFNHSLPLLFSWMLIPFLNSIGVINTFRFYEITSTLLYVLSMFCCLFVLTGRKKQSLFLAMISSFPVSIYPIELWGTFAFNMALARTVFLPLLPPLVTAWLLVQDKPKYLYLTFFLIGIASIPYPLTGYSIVPPMLLTQLVIKRFSKQAWIEAFICGALSCLPIIPYALALKSLVHKTPPLPASDFQTLIEAFSYRFSSISAKGLVNGIVSGILAVFAWLVFGILGFINVKNTARNYLLGFTICCLVLFVSVVLFNYLVLIPQGHPPFQLLNISRILRVAFLPLILMTGFYLTRFTGYKKIAVVLALFLLTSLDLARLQKDISIASSIGDTVDVQLKKAAQHYHLKVDKASETQQLEKDITGMTNWLSSNTDSSKALIHYSDVNVKPTLYIMAFAHRSVTYTDEHFGSLSFFDHVRFIEWYRRITHLKALVAQQGTCSSSEINDMTSLYPVTHFVCKKSNLSPDANHLLKKAYENTTFTIYERVSASRPGVR